MVAVDDDDHPCWKLVRWTFVGFIAFPILLAISLLTFVIWFIVTVSGIGPLIQWILTQQDDALLDMEKLLERHKDLKLITIPGGIHSASDGSPYKVCIRYTEPVDKSKKNYPPVVIPNALGVTLACSSRTHELLVEKGFRVLSFDRMGVGFSDDNPSGKSPSAADVAREMNFVMQSITSIPADTKWLAVCPSMGHCVTMAFCALFPNRLVGLVNVDGVPSPFIRSFSIFKYGGMFLEFYSYFVWTGSFRWFVSVMQRVFLAFESRAFTVEILRAQFNRPRFLKNSGLELITIMSCCELATAALGDISLLRMDDDDVKILATAAPARSIIVDERAGGELRRETSDRSESELGSEWVSGGKVDMVVQKIQSRGALEVDLEADYINGTSGICSSTSSTTSSTCSSSNSGEKGERQVVIGDLAGGVRVTDMVHPLKPQWSELVVRVLSMRSFRGT